MGTGRGRMTSIANSGGKDTTVVMTVFSRRSSSVLSSAIRTVIWIGAAVVVGWNNERGSGLLTYSDGTLSVRWIHPGCSRYKITVRKRLNGGVSGVIWSQACLPSHAVGTLFFSLVTYGGRLF